MTRTKTLLLGPALIAVALLAVAPGAASGQACFPTCIDNDGRFLTLVGTGLQSLAGEGVSVEIGVPAGTTNFDLDLFDPGNAGPTPHWDFGNTPIEFTLYADPLADGNGTFVVTQFVNTGLPDNVWYTVPVATGPEAESPSGNFFYRLEVRNTDPTQFTLYSFKVRAPSLAIKPQPFAFQAPVAQFNDIPILYPAFPSLTPTTYDGIWNYFLEVPVPTSRFDLWDGDLDHGTADCSVLDTDDPDTPNEVPEFALGTAAVAEGVAVGLGPLSVPPRPCQTTGAPNDDEPDPFFRREPSIFYEVIDSEGNVYVNSNPSGNQEWERWRLDTDPSCDDDPSDGSSNADVCSSEPYLPFGIWKVRLVGDDLSNLNAWNFAFPRVGIDPPGDPVPRLRPFLLGDTVWFEYPGGVDGVQDGAEPGIAGVVVELVHPPTGVVVATATTDANGNYTFPVDAGEFSVNVATSNFEPGGPLEGLISTTGNQLTFTIVDDNVLTYDFGYRADGAIGDFVWHDVDNDGVQDGGEPGIPGVSVTLTGDVDGDGTADFTLTTVTDGSGLYLFEGLPEGDYTVSVDPSTVPAGFEPTFDLDGLATLHTADLALGFNQERLDADFGYALCGPCAGKVTRLTMGYLGGAPALVEVYGRRGGKKRTELLFSGIVAGGGSFEVVGPDTGNNGFTGTLGTEIEILVGGASNTRLHTSCSVPIGPGTVSGDFEVLAGASRRGGPLCPLS